MAAVRLRVVLGAVAVLAALIAALVVGRTSAPDPAAKPHAPGAVDIGFAQDMSVHHDQAVLMANLALTRHRPDLASLADAILMNQSQEVGVLRGWLRLWDEPAASPSPMAWMGMSHVEGMDMSSLMPGMASPTQLERLYRLNGGPFDRLFLQLMIRHHEGGLLMTRAAVGAARLQVVRDAARQMAVDQVSDLGTMRALLHADGGRPLPPPRLAG